MYKWLEGIVNFPGHGNDMILSGAVIVTILFVGFILYCLSRIFK